MEEEDFEEMLINLVKTNEILYNSQFAVGKSVKEINKLKHKAWEDISKKIGVSAHICKQTWEKIKNEFTTSISNKRVIKDGRSEVISDYKHDRMLEFLLPHIEITTQPQEVIRTSISSQTMKDLRENPKISSANNKLITIELDDVPIEVEEITKSSLMSNNLVQLSEIKELNKSDQNDSNENEISDGELKITIDGMEKPLIIPTKFISDDCEDDESVFVRLNPLCDDGQDNGNCVIPVKLQLDDPIEDYDLSLPYHKIFDEFNFDKDLDLQVAPGQVEEKDKIWLMPADNNNSTEKVVCKCKNVNADDADGEEYFYAALAMSANQIDSYKERLMLRQTVTKIVMSTVKKYLQSKANNNK